MARKQVERRKLTLDFSVLADNICQQVKQQGYLFETEKLAQYYSKVDVKHYVNALVFGGFLTQQEANKVFKRIVNRVATEIKPINKE